VLSPKKISGSLCWLPEIDMLPSQETVNKKLSCEGSVFMQRGKLSAEQKAEIVRLHLEKGESQSFIAKQYSINESDVKKIHITISSSRDRNLHQ